MPSRLHRSIEATVQAIETAIKLIEPLTVNSDSSTVLWPSGTQLRRLIETSSDEATATWDQQMPDVAGLLEAEVTDAG